MPIGIAGACAQCDIYHPVATLCDEFGHQGPTQPGFVDYGSVARGGHTDVAVPPDLKM
jgi:hypothetical protein